MPLRSRVFLALTCSVLILSACGKSDDKDKNKPSEPVDKLYNDALNKLSQKEYKESVKAFEEVERQHPYSPWAVRSEIMAAFANYRNGQYDEAISQLDRFVKQHPGNTNAPYAYYLKAICYYEQITDVGRDQKITQQAQQALKEIVSRFPDSEYARDARLKLDLVADHLAGKEMEIGRYYEKHLEYLAAINRFRTVVEKYQTTSHTPEALHRLVECYLKLGVVDEAKRYAAVLGYNYPGSQWYKDSYALMNGKPLPVVQSDEPPSWWHRLMPF
jgi:outer membrane protein assembly factor BamD